MFRPKILTLYFYFALFSFFLLGSIGFLSRNLEGHLFRQSQTAISIDYLKISSDWTHYETPVLGSPWSIPMEFPLYQGITAFVSNGFSSLPLEAVARLVSVCFFLLGLFFMFRSLILMGWSHSKAQLGCALILLSPIYLFWSRSVLIESTAWALGWGTIYGLIHCVTANRLIWYGFVGLFFSSMASLVKITTWVGFAVFFCLVVVVFYRSNLRSKKRTLLLGFSALVTLLISSVWIRHSDSLKSQNVLARDFLTSSALSTWNFGTFSQKLDLNVWNHLFSFRPNLAVGNLYLVFILIFLFNWRSVSENAKKWFFCLLISYLSGFITFTNLHYVHDYYSYANAHFLVLTFAIIFSEFYRWWIETGSVRTKLLFCGLVILYTSSNLEKYIRKYLPFQKDPSVPFSSLSQAWADHVPAGSKAVVFIWGHDWNPAIPYYLKTRAVMDRWNLPVESEKFQTTVLKVADSEKKALFCNAYREKPLFIERRLKVFHLSPVRYVEADHCKLYY